MKAAPKTASAGPHARAAVGKEPRSPTNHCTVRRRLLEVFGSADGPAGAGALPSKHLPRRATVVALLLVSACAASAQAVRGGDADGPRGKVRNFERRGERTSIPTRR